MAVNRHMLEMYAELHDNFEQYATDCLKLRNKAGKLVPFVFNEGQGLLNKKMDDQKARTGRVRLLVPKARQVGVSTLVSGRYYHNTSMNTGRNTYILSHHRDSTAILFEMVERFHDNDPFAPKKGKDNTRELDFTGMDSTYTVATAGSEAAGRGGAQSNFHGSEVGFWENAKGHFAASVQAIPDIEDTEITLESSANGVTGEFYERVQDAIAQRGDYEYFFLPWYIMPEYSRRVPDDFELSEEDDGGLFNEREYAENFNLSLEQMMWRRSKIMSDFRGDIMLFDQEYPASIELAFQQKAEGAYHDAGKILKARKRKVEAHGPLIMGVDPAGEGGDRFAIAFRRGYVCEKLIWRDKIDHMEAVEWLKSLIDDNDPAVVFIDAGGIGKSVISTLRGKGERYNIPHVRGINFGSPSQFKLAHKLMPGPKNRRAEMQQRVKEWLALEEGVSIPDMDVLQSDLINVRIKPNLTNDLQLMSKQEMRKQGIRSPDLADALGLTFADLIFIREFTDRPKKPGFMQNEKSGAIVAPSPADIADYGRGGGPGSWMI